MHCKMVRSSGFQERPQLAFFCFIKKTFRIRLKRKTSSLKLNELVSKRERYSFAGYGNHNNLYQKAIKLRLSLSGCLINILG